MNWQERAEKAEDVLRSLASFVGAGGYNAEKVDADVFEQKIRWGIWQIMERLEKAEAELARLREQEPVAEYDGVELSRYTLRWTNGPLPVGTKLYAEPEFDRAAEENRFQAEELEALHMCLRDNNVPTHNKSGLKLSAWGRVVLFAEMQSAPKPAAPAYMIPFTDSDMDEIHQLAYELGGTDGGEYALDGDQLEQVIVKAASLFYKPAAPAVQFDDEFNGDTPHMIRCIESLLEMDAKGVLAPHGIGGHARTLLAAAACRLAVPAVPEEWREVLQGMMNMFDLPMFAWQGTTLYKQARALLQSAPTGEPK